MYAIVRVGGKQYRVEKGDQLVVDRMAEDEGAKVVLEPLLFRSDDTVFDSDGLAKVTVEAVVRGHKRGDNGYSGQQHRSADERCRVDVVHAEQQGTHRPAERHRGNPADCDTHCRE